MVSSARSSPRRPCTFLRTEPPPHRRPLLPSSPKQTGARYPGAAFSIPRRAPIESDQSDEWWSFRLANPFQSSMSFTSDGIPVHASGVPMQLIELVLLATQEIVEVSGNPESSENRASIIAVLVRRRDGMELMRIGRYRADGTGNTRMRANC